MAKYNKKCQILWEGYKDPNDFDISSYDLQEAIYNRFPSILSIQIRDLFTSNSKQKGRLRLKDLNDVYTVLGKLLCSFALSNLWKAIIDEQTYAPKTYFIIRPEYKEDLKRFFNLTKERAPYFDYFWLSSTIDRIFIDNELAPFLPELRTLLEQFSSNQDLYGAYNFLEFRLKRRLLANNIASIEVVELCELAERQLALLLQHCAFLISYQLISVNDISVKKSLRVAEADFIHRKVILRGVEDTVMNRDPQVKKNFTCNHAVLITRNFQLEEQALTLCPFLIDQNAYKENRKEQAKIHFLAGRTETGHLYYQHAEVLSEGFELIQDRRRTFRTADLEEINTLLQLFGEDLGL